MKVRTDIVLKDIGELLTMGGSGAAGIGLIKDAALAVHEGRVVWVGFSSAVEDHCEVLSDTEIISAGGKVVTPGFVDSHTHPLFGATRQDEFAMRAAGADYEEIAEAGGGILNSVKKTRAASNAVLEENMRHHLSIMLSNGTTTVEAKSGYGLDLTTELRCLEIAGKVGKEVPQTIVPTFMGAHEVPEEFKGRHDEYIDYLIHHVNPRVKEQGIAEFVDIFCEKGVFTEDQATRYLDASSRLGFMLKIHADEFYDTGGAAVAVKTGAVSADHLLSISDENIELIAESNTVATLLPGTALFLKKPFPPGRKLLDAGASVALATDFNPGSCFCDSMPLIVSLAVCQCGFTVEEALVSATAKGAAALRLEEQKGSLTTGFDADFVIWNCSDFRTIPYHLGNPDVDAVYCAGLKVYST